MTPPLIEDGDGVDLNAWLMTVPSIPTDFPRGILTPDSPNQGIAYGPRFREPSPSVLAVPASIANAGATT
jgi:hypothetical protein